MRTTVYLLLFLAVLCLPGCQGGSSSHDSTTGSDPGNDNTGGDSGYDPGTIDYAALEDLILKDDPAYAYEVGSVAYYVDASNGSDTNDGSENSPFATVLYALNQAQGGEVIYVAGGDYGDLSFGAIYSSNSNKAVPIPEVFTDWVTLKAMDGQQPTLDHVKLGTSTDEGGWLSIPFDRIYNSNLRLRIDGFRITDTVTITGSRYVEIRNCKISKKGDFSAMTNAEKHKYMDETGISVRNGQYVKLLYNEITSTGRGISGMTTDFVVKGNHIHHITHDGIQVHGGTNWLIENNIIHDLDDGVSDTDAFATEYNQHVDGMQLYLIASSHPEIYANKLENFTFRGNLIYHVEAMDIMLNDDSVKDSGYYNVVWENNIFGPSNGYLFIMGAVIERGHVFRHNTILYTPNDQWTSQWGRVLGANFGSPDSTSYYVQTWWTASNHTDYYFYNNILVKSQISPWFSMDSHRLAYNNIYYTGNSDLILDDDAGFTVSDLPYAPIETNVLDAIESGIVPGALVTDSPAIDAGDMVIPGLIPYNRDFLGQKRDEFPDVGAIEE